jgi:hypothetical protein
MTCDQTLKQAIDELASHIGGSRSRQYDLLAFSTSFPHLAKELEGCYGSLSEVVATALGQRLRDQTARLNSLKRNGDAIAAYQFYSVLAGMRNGRSHFRVRPEVHDDDLEFSAGWLWMFFIEGLQVLAAGKRPIRAGKVTDLQNLMEAASAQWYPTATFVDSSEGEAFCTGIIVRFGNMLMRGIFSVDSELDIVATFAQRLAANVAISGPGVRSDDLSLTTKATTESERVPANRPDEPKAAKVSPTGRAQAIEIHSKQKARPPRGSTYRPFEDALRGFKA